MSQETKRKMIFAKATEFKLCAVVVYAKDDRLRVCDALESASIIDFIEDVEVLAQNHLPEMVQFECSVYLDECKYLRQSLSQIGVKVRGYNSDGTYLNRIISQSSWIESNVDTESRLEDFIDQISSFNINDPDKNNIALDVLSDATKYFRRYIIR